MWLKREENWFSAQLGASFGTFTHQICKSTFLSTSLLTLECLKCGLSITRTTVYPRGLWKQILHPDNCWHVISIVPCREGEEWRTFSSLTFLSEMRFQKHVFGKCSQPSLKETSRLQNQWSQAYEASVTFITVLQVHKCGELRQVEGYLQWEEDSLQYNWGFLLLIDRASAGLCIEAAQLIQLIYLIAGAICRPL